MTVYIVVGTREGVYQDAVGENFVSHEKKEIITGFLKEEFAKNFIKESRLLKPKKQRFGDTFYYKGGYFEMEIESVDIQ